MLVNFIILLLILCVFNAALVAALTYMIFLYESVNHPEHTLLGKGRAPDHITPALALVALRGAVQAFVAAFAVPISYPFGLLYRLRARLFTKSVVKAVGPGSTSGNKRPPVVFVHGLYHNESAWLLYKAWMTQAGWSRFYSLGYSSFRTDFDSLVGKLDATLLRLQRYWPGERPVLIGHSMGGLIIRSFLAKEKNQLRASAAVTLSTPHQGSRLSGLGLGKLAHSLAFKGPLIQRLEQTEHPAGIPCLAIYSPLDNFVLPQQGLMIATPGWTLRESAPLSHASILYNKATAQILLGALDGLRAE